MATLTKLEVRCGQCDRLPIPPVYHFGDVLVCSNCRDESLEMNECVHVTSLLNNMAIPCRNKENGCTLLLALQNLDAHAQDCAYVESMCLVCDTYFVNVTTLENHLKDDHEPIEINSEASHVLTIAPRGDKCVQNYVIREKSTGIFFLLTIDDECLFFYHMCWGEPRLHCLTIPDPDNEDLWYFMGLSSKALTGYSKRRGVYCLPIPKSIFPENKPIIIELCIGKKRTTTSMAAIINNFDAHKCLICFEVPATTPIYHCRSSHSHLICSNCINGLAKAAKKDKKVFDKKCKFCMNGDLMVLCEAGTSILDNCEFTCPNKENGCRVIFPLKRFHSHVNYCLKSQLFCPVCGKGFKDIALMERHLQNHKPKAIDYMKDTQITIVPGLNLLQEEATEVYYLLIFEDDSLSLQHMRWGEKADYSLEFSDSAANAWEFAGTTNEVALSPRLSSRNLKIPHSIPPFPITVSVGILR